MSTKIDNIESKETLKNENNIDEVIEFSNDLPSFEKETPADLKEINSPDDDRNNNVDTNNNNNENNNGEIYHAEKAAGHAGFTGTMMNMGCNIMGGALLVLPMMIQDSSLVPGIVLAVLFGMVGVTTILMLSDSAEALQVFSYRTLCASSLNGVIKKRYALWFGKFVDYCLFLYTYGLLIGYCRIVVDSMPSVMKDLFHVSSHSIASSGLFWLILAAVVFFMPLSSAPALAKLWFVSVFGFLTIVYALFTVIGHFFKGDFVASPRSEHSIVSKDIDYVKFTTAIFKALPVLAEGYSCHYNAPFYYKELKDRSPKLFRKLMMTLFPFIIIFYTVVGVCGYLMFGNKKITETKGNIMNAFNAGDIAVNIGRFVLFIHFLSVFPIVCIGGRNSLNNIIFGTPNRPRWQYVIESIILVVTSAILGYLVPGVAIPVQVFGSLFGIPEVIIIPAVVYMCTFWRKRKNTASATNKNNDGITNNNSDNVKYIVDPEILEQGGEEFDLDENSKYFHKIQGNVKEVIAFKYLALIYIPIGICLAVIAFTVTIVQLAKK